MKKLLTLSVMTIALMGCTASVIGLKNPRTGDVGQCRRGWWGTVGTMEECAKGYEAKGYVRMSEQEAEALPPPADPDDPEAMAAEAARKKASAQAHQQQLQPGAALQPAQPAFDPYARYAQPPMQQPAVAPQMAPAPAPMPMPAPAAPAEEEKPYFSQYPTSTTHRGGMQLPEFLK